MKKLLVLFLLVFALALAGCSSNSGSENNEDNLVQDSVKLSQTTYKNIYFGFELTIPDGWYLISSDDDNINPTGSGTKDESDLAVYEYDDGSKYIEFLDFSNLKDENSSNHIEVEVFSETYNGAVDAYIDYVVGYHADKEADSDTFSLVSRSTATIDGMEYITLHFKTDREEEPYFVDYYICEKQGYYFNFSFIYWAENTEAEGKIIKYIDENVVWNN